MTTPASPPVTQALILMAGTGSRLRGDETSTPKPLIPLLGRPLVSYILERVAQAGIETVYAVVGYESKTVMREIGPLIPSGLQVHFVENRDWQKQNGISVLAAANCIRSSFLLTMSDHLFDQELIRTLMKEGTEDGINLAVDRKIGSIFDLDDAMKVQTEGDRITAIGKNLASYNAIDTGFFICSPILFEYLDQVKRNDDCSLADGVRLAAVAGKARAIDIGNAWWQDVDTPAMLDIAERRLQSGPDSRTAPVEARSYR
jgi:1L-myo-inositol 1-phosphate cytidylyltransferase